MSKEIKIADIQKIFGKHSPKNVSKLISDSKKRVGDNITDKVIYIDTFSKKDKAFLRSNKGKEFFEFIKNNSILKPDYYGSKRILLSNFFRDIGLYDKFISYVKDIYIKNNNGDLEDEIKSQNLEIKGGDEYLEQKYFPYLELEEIAGMIKKHYKDLKKESYEKEKLFMNIKHDESIEIFLTMFSNFGQVGIIHDNKLLSSIDLFFQEYGDTYNLQNIINYFKLSELNEFIEIFYENKINKV